MKKPSDDSGENQKELWEKIIGLGETSIRKSYYPELQKRIRELEDANEELSRQIEEKKQAELALQQSETSFREIYNSTNEAIFIHDAQQGNILDVNDTTIKMFGYLNKEEMLKLTIHELSAGIYPFDGQMAMQKLKLAAQGAPQTFEWYAKTLKGELFWAEVSLRSALIGGVPRILAVVRNVNERKHAEIALRESEKRFQTLALISPVGIFRTNANGDTIYVNPQWCQISGLSVQEALGDGWLKAVHPDDVDKLFKGWKHDTLLRKESVAEYRFLKANGEVAWVLGQASPELNHKNQIVGYVGTITDISRLKTTEDKLKESEAFLADIVNAQPTGIYRLRVEKGKVFYSNGKANIHLDFVNQQFYDILGLDKNVIGKDPDAIFKCLYPDDVDDFFNKNNEIISSFSDFYWEGRILRDGETRWVSLESIPRELADGDRVWTGVLSDITSRKQAEEALRKSEEQYKTLFVNASDGIFVSYSNQFVFVNPRLQEMLGCSFSELLSIPFSDFIYPEDKDWVLQQYASLFKDIQFKNLPARFYTKSGELRYFEINALLIEWEGKPAFLSFIKDITEMKNAQDLLRASEERFRLIFERSPIGIIRYDKQGFIQACNDHFIEILGSEREKLIGLNMTLLPNKKVVESLIKALKGERSDFEGEYISITGNKTTHIRLQFAPIFNSHGLVDGGVGIVEDFAERLRNEKLEQEIIIAKKSAEFKQNFLANMSHEIRTPLTGIEGMAQILSKTPLSEEQTDYLETILYSSQNLREIINQILDYSKIEAGRMSIKTRLFKTSELIYKTEKLFSSLCGNQIRYEMIVSDSLPDYIEADDMRVFQIITNFISNAIKYAPNGLISFRIDKISHLKDGKIELKIEVADQGPGIHKEKIKDLFAPFSQLEQGSQRTIEGTGLGLSISKELAQMMGGSIGVESVPEQGSVFWFTFIATPRSKPLKESSDFDLVDDTIISSKSILLVEDKKVNQKVVTLMLNSLGHSVTVAQNGLEALNIYKPDLFDLILMDIQMPVMDGITATQRLRQKYKDLPPIVGLSANAFEGDREKYMGMGMDDYLTKPVKEDDFLDLLRRLFLKNETL